MLVAPLAIAAEGPPLGSRTCTAPGVNPRVVTRFPTNLKTPRLLFKAEPNGPEYYVDMHPANGGLWWAMMPAVDPSTKAISYRITALDANNRWVTGQSVTIGTSASCPKDQMSQADLDAANNIVLGLTSPGETSVPVGFECRGIKAVIDANGQMRPADDCRRALAAIPGAGGTTTASRFSPGVIAAAVIGASAIGYAISEHGKNNKAISNSRP